MSEKSARQRAGDAVDDRVDVEICEPVMNRWETGTDKGPVVGHC